ncbi:transposase [Flammeovirga sp. MY04]|uniref:transposase n=1 Tax=Flammeovirga sp. MY04 TaxID=1191459 RepID=UPI00080611C7|nr:transposase [Flammeovirga sp. MY04]ANQ51545.1 transposase [Flammeovirga sp. MY04]
MLKTGKHLQKKRKFSDDFKMKVVQEYEYGQLSVRDLSKFYSISTKVIYSWIYKFSKYNKSGIQVVEMKNSQENKLKSQQKKIEELERALGQKQLYLDFLEKVIDLANEEYEIDIKKNFETLQSGGSKTTKKK